MEKYIHNHLGLLGQRKLVHIVTFSSVINFGAVMQAYALKYQIEKMGFNVKVVDYRPLFARDACLNIGTNIFAFIKKIFQYFIFKFFTMKHLNLTKTTYRCMEDFYDNIIKTDYVVCGSDQIWNIKITGGIDSIYLLDFPVGKASKIAYAVSMGETSMPEHLKNEFNQSVRPFKAISVREQLVREQLPVECNEVSIALDPTLLPVNYSGILPRRKYVKKYIAMYFVIRDEELENAAKKLRDILGIPIINISLYRFIEADKNEYFLNPGEWLGRIKDATIICTNSFHGTAMSIVFKKKFYTIELHGSESKLNSRVKELLDSLKLAERLVCSSSDIPDSKDEVLSPLNYAEASYLLRKRQEDSLSFLKKALEVE